MKSNDRSMDFSFLLENWKQVDNMSLAQKEIKDVFDHDESWLEEQTFFPSDTLKTLYNVFLK